MRKAILVVTLVAGLSGCGFFRKSLGISDPPAYTPSRTTSIWGDWVLATAPDSTAFYGASQVQLKLDQSRFTITAAYPTRPSVVITGNVAQTADGGLVTLDPQTGLEQIGSGTYAWRPGERITVVASAAGNTLVFAPPRDLTARPSSVWYRKEAAERAGTTIPPGDRPTRP